MIEDEVELKEQVIKNHVLVLFNDDLNTFDDVIDLLVEICNHSRIQAEQCAMLVHYKGKCSVKTGELKELTIMGKILTENQLTVEIN